MIFFNFYFLIIFYLLGYVYVLPAYWVRFIMGTKFIGFLKTLTHKHIVKYFGKILKSFQGTTNSWFIATLEGRNIQFGF